MITSFDQLQELKRKRDHGTGRYNYRDEASDLQWELLKQTPCPDHVLIHAKNLGRALKFCNQLLKNQCLDEDMNDLVKDEFRPHDQRQGSQPYGHKAPSTSYDAPGMNGPAHSRMFGEKT